MGQYYKGIILNGEKFKKHNTNKGKILAHLVAYDYNNGAKLTEHSYINNDMVNAMEALINTENGKYCGFPIVWGGDYADEETVTRTKDNRRNLYSLCNDATRVDPLSLGGFPTHYRYIINRDTKQYVDTAREDMPSAPNWGAILHPLPLLVCEGNGRGGGDYDGNGMDLVGSWARNVVVVSNDAPTEDYTELVPNFAEPWWYK